MKVNVLGTSCTWFTRNNTSFIIDDDIVFDVPSGNYKLITQNIDVKKIRCVLISHFHSDHFGDLRIITTEFLRHFEQFGRSEHLRIYGPKGIAQRIIDTNIIFCSAQDEQSMEKLTKYIDFIELEDGFEFEEGGYKIKAYKMVHGAAETFGFTFEDESGKTVAFSADTAMCDNLHKMLENANVAFVEMSAVKPSLSHLNVDDFIELSKKYSNLVMYPVHTSDLSHDYAVEKGYKLNYLNDGDVLEV
ncbi:MAG: ribonuclease Z [Clostridia bacterium]|nr:ribonuclease Z [Clostridia bacterium]